MITTGATIIIVLDCVAIARCGDTPSHYNLVVLIPVHLINAYIVFRNDKGR